MLQHFASEAITITTATTETTQHYLNATGTPPPKHLDINTINQNTHIQCCQCSSSHQQRHQNCNWFTPSLLPFPEPNYSIRLSAFPPQSLHAQLRCQDCIPYLFNTHSLLPTYNPRALGQLCNLSYASTHSHFSSIYAKRCLKSLPRYAHQTHKHLINPMVELTASGGIWLAVRLFRLIFPLWC